jgi:hypothetical protein
MLETQPFRPAQESFRFSSFAAAFFGCMRLIDIPCQLCCCLLPTCLTISIAYNIRRLRRRRNLQIRRRQCLRTRIASGIRSQRRTLTPAPRGCGRVCIRSRSDVRQDGEGFVGHCCVLFLEGVTEVGGREDKVIYGLCIEIRAEKYSTLGRCEVLEGWRYIRYLNYDWPLIVTCNQLLHSPASYQSVDLRRDNTFFLLSRSTFYV